VRVERAGHDPFEGGIQLAAGEKRTIKALLTPKPARLVVRSNVSGDRVYIDDRLVGPTGAKVHSMDAGQHRIRVEKPGYQSFETEIRLSPGGKETIHAQLVEELLSPGKKFRDRLQDGSPGPEMLVIPAGNFLMGSPANEKGRESNESPQHRVHIDSFALGITEVTFADYDRFAKATGRKLPSDIGWGRGKRPVVDVSCKDATAYTEWLSDETGKQYRLPTEAECGNMRHGPGPKHAIFGGMMRYLPVPMPTSVIPTVRVPGHHRFAVMATKIRPR